jgi:hypothetical protein
MVAMLGAASRRAGCIILASTALALCSCGRSSPTITHPGHALYVICHGGGNSDARKLLGLSFHAAQARVPASLKGCTIRAIEINGRAVPTTQEYSSNRIDVATNSGVIVKIVGVG